MRWAGHENPHTLGNHYDAGYSRANALAYLQIVPTGTALPTDIVNDLKALTHEPRSR